MTGIERANGHRPDALLDLLHPGLRMAPRPDRDGLGYDIDRTLGAVLKLHADIPQDAFTAHTLGTEREGSGVVIDDDGLVLTIGYLVTEASQVTLTTNEGAAVAAEPLAYDHESGLGMVRALGPLGASPVPIGESASFAEGDRCVVASFGGYDHAIAARVVSKREFAGAWEYMLDEAIFTAPLHPYWGGAALLDSAGRLVGIGSLFTEEAIEGDRMRQGNMFVPIDLLAPIRRAMETTGRSGRPSRPWLGMHTAEADDRLIVTGVSPDTPADKGGVHPGDIVLGVDGVAVKGLAHMYRTVWDSGAAGGQIRFTLLRDDDVITLRIRSGDRYDFLDLPRRH